MNDITRRILGTVFGLIISLSYALVANLINPLFLPDVPLYHPDPGLTVSILLTCLTGALIGLIASWPEEALPGVLLASLVGTFVVIIYSLRSMSGGLEFFSGFFVLLVMTFLPRAFLFLPIAGLIRWVLSIWAQEFQTVSFSVQRLALSLLSLVLIAGLVGAFYLYPRYARQSLTQMDQLIQMGMQIPDEENLPTPLKKVSGFARGARGAYTLELSDNPDLLPVQRPIASYSDQEFAIFVRFENGYRFGCVYTSSVPDPSCGAY